MDELLRAESERDLDEIRTELQETGLLRRTQGKRPGKKKQKPSEPLRYESRDGFEILVGRNNTQNDELTFRTARRTDLWFHVKDLHGSHVILRCEGAAPSDEAVHCAAALAARHSQAGDGGRTAVDYTMVRNVKKPSGALPGRVIYTDYQTVIVQVGDEV